jgi:hypothetical protein
MIADCSPHWVGTVAVFMPVQSTLWQDFIFICGVPLLVLARHTQKGGPVVVLASLLHRLNAASVTLWAYPVSKLAN